jgi:dihydrofolate reductase
LGDKRILVGVSQTIPPGNGYGTNRLFVPSLENAVTFANEQNAYRIIFLGGEAVWLYGLDIADEAHFTLIDRVCDDNGVKKLKRRLHELAYEKGMALSSTEKISVANAWASEFKFQTWKR